MNIPRVKNTDDIAELVKSINATIAAINKALDALEKKMATKQVTSK